MILPMIRRSLGMALHKTLYAAHYPNSYMQGTVLELPRNAQ
jgi:hypothetical protein